jgi:hypothetical protein
VGKRHRRIRARSATGQVAGAATEKAGLEAHRPRRPAQPAFSRRPLSQSTEPKPGPGRQQGLQRALSCHDKRQSPASSSVVGPGGPHSCERDSAVSGHACRIAGAFAAICANPIRSSPASMPAKHYGSGFESSSSSRLTRERSLVRAQPRPSSVASRGRRRADVSRHYSSTTSTTSKTPETCSFSTNAESRSTR